MKFCELPFSAYEFFIPEKIKWKSVLATKKAVFQGTNTETAVQKNVLGTIKTHEILRKQHFFPFLGYVSYIFSISAFFLSKCPGGKKYRENFNENQTQKTNFWRKLLRKSHKNQTQKPKMDPFWGVELILSTYAIYVLAWQLGLTHIGIFLPKLDFFNRSFNVNSFNFF